MFRSPKEYLLGTNSHEGALYIIGPLRQGDFTTYQAAKESLRAFAGRRLPAERLDAFCTSMMDYYIGLEEEKKSNDDVMKGMVKMIGDFLFVTPTTHTAIVYSGQYIRFFSVNSLLI